MVCLKKEHSHSKSHNSLQVGSLSLKKLRDKDLYERSGGKQSYDLQTRHSAECEFPGLKNEKWWCAICLSQMSRWSITDCINLPKM